MPKTTIEPLTPKEEEELKKYLRDTPSEKFIGCNCCIDSGAKKMLHAILTDEIKKLNEKSGASPRFSMRYLEGLLKEIEATPECKSISVPSSLARKLIRSKPRSS